jgi:hypothetical protein
MGTTLAPFQTALATGRLFLFIDPYNWGQAFATPFPWGFKQYSKLFCPRNDSLEVYGVDKWQHLKADLRLPKDEKPRFFLYREGGRNELLLYGSKMGKYAHRDFEHGKAFKRAFLKWMWGPNLEVKAAVQAMKSKVPKGNLLVGIHARVMHTAVPGYYMAFWHCYQNLYKHLGVDKDTKMTVFVASDSKEVKAHLSEMAGDSYIENTIPIVHTGTTSDHVGIVGVADDLFSLAACDVLILAAKSTWYGRYASNTVL